MWSFGVCLFQLTCGGARPFSAGTLADYKVDVTRTSYKQVLVSRGAGGCLLPRELLGRFEHDFFAVEPARRATAATLRRTCRWFGGGQDTAAAAAAAAAATAGSPPPSATAPAPVPPPGPTPTPTPWSEVATSTSTPSTTAHAHAWSRIRRLAAEHSALEEVRLLETSAVHPDVTGPRGGRRAALQLPPLTAALPMSRSLPDLSDVCVGMPDAGQAVVLPPLRRGKAASLQDVAGTTCILEHELRSTRRAIAAQRLQLRHSAAELQRVGQDLRAAGELGGGAPLPSRSKEYVHEPASEPSLQAPPTPKRKCRGRKQHGKKWIGRSRPRASTPQPSATALAEGALAGAAGKLHAAHSTLPAARSPLTPQTRFGHANHATR